MIVVVNNGQRALPTEDVARLIGAPTNTSAIAALKFANVSPAAKQPCGRGHRYFWPEERVLQRADRMRAVVAKNLRHSPIRKEPAPVAANKAPDDDAVEAVRKMLDGLKPYVCSLGEKNALVHSNVDRLSAQVRVLTIGVNRLLKAAGLREVPEMPSDNGGGQ